MLNDTSKCVGCRACQSACKRWNSLPAESLGYDALYDNPSDLSAKTWTVIKAKEFQANGSKELLLAKYQCMHCAEASCVEVCPTKALYHHYFGFVAYDKEKCSGCGYCTQTCPFQIPHLSGSTLTGFEKMDKCTFCQDRVAYGQMPACAEACPVGAITFGNRTQLEEEGRNRVSELRETYPNASLYGENELGGLQVMYVLKEPPEVYGLPEAPQNSAAVTAWQDVLKPLGYAVVGAVTLGLLVNLIANRVRVPAPEKDKRR
jgi:formate dehydrogenase iron-sulfur subunit